MSHLGEIHAIYKKYLDLSVCKDDIILELIILQLGPNVSLSFASSVGRLDWVKFLIEKRGADIHYADDDALINACDNGRLDMVQYLVEKKDGADIHAFNDQALVFACGQNHRDVVKYLLEKGAKVHNRTDGAFIMACEWGALEVVKYLVEKKIDIYPLLEYGIERAYENKHDELANYLCTIR